MNGDRAALWRFYYAMLYRFDGHRPPEPTPAQWQEISAAQSYSITNATIERLCNSGLLTHVSGGTYRLTEAGLAALHSDVDSAHGVQS